MNPDDHDRASAEIERLQTRVRRLAEEKAYLQLIVRLIEQLNPRPGLQEMVSNMLCSIVETIGGTDIKLWYWIEDEMYYTSFLSEGGIVTGIDDPVAAQVARERDFVEVPGDPTEALLRDGVLPGSWTWCFPLRVGQELIGVIKLENIHISGSSLRNYLPIFFGHAALLLSNEIRNHLRQKAQAALRAKTEELDSYFNNALDLFCIACTDGRFRKLNSAWREALGYEIADLQGKRFLDLVHPDDMAATLAAIKTLAKQNAVANFVNRYRHKDGSWRWVEWSARPQGNLIFSAARDITERKRAERMLAESKAELQQVYDSMPVMICQLDPARKVIEANGYFRSFTGWPDHPVALSEKACGVLGCANSLDDPRGCGFGPRCKTCTLRLAIQDTLQTGLTHTDIEYQTTLLIGDARREVVLLGSTTLIEKEGGNRVLLSLIDITERKRAEETLRAALEEKTVLLKEVHHRVKNNLQIVGSLLNLQIDRIETPEVASALRDTQNRVRSMALLHETLYRSDSLARIGLADYLERLCAQLWRAAGGTVAGVRLERRIDDVSLSMDQAVPCGLLVNELVSNALKHAFPGGRGGCIRVDAQIRADRWLALAVADDGVGLPPEVDPDRTDTLGLQLVFILTQQLQGTLAIAREGGTEIRISFPIKDA